MARAKRTLEDMVKSPKTSPAILRLTKAKLKKQGDGDNERTLDDYFKHLPSDGSGLM